MKAYLDFDTSVLHEWLDAVSVTEVSTLRWAWVYDLAQTLLTSFLMFNIFENISGLIISSYLVFVGLLSVLILTLWSRLLKRENLWVYSCLRRRRRSICILFEQ